MNTNNSNSKANTAANPKMNASHADMGFQEKIMTQIKELGDSLERAGEKVEKSGWEMIGQAISKLGNSLEHLTDKDGMKAGPTISVKAYTDREFDDKSKKSPDLKASVSKVGGNDSQAL